MNQYTSRLSRGSSTATTSDTVACRRLIYSPNRKLSRRRLFIAHHFCRSKQELRPHPLRYLDRKPMQGVSHIELLLLALLLLIAAFAVVAKWLTTPYPIILVISGLLLSLIPRAPQVVLNPSVVFFVFLPPLLFSAAFQTSWREFRRNLPSILMLAFGLVAFTVFGVAAGIRWIVPGFDWKLGMVLGAVVATTDPISATATARRLGIPQAITDLLEAESLVNDGSGLVALKFTAALVITGQTPTFLEGAGGTSLPDLLRHSDRLVCGTDCPVCPEQDFGSVHRDYDQSDHSLPRVSGGRKRTLLGSHGYARLRYLSGPQKFGFLFP